MKEAKRDKAFDHSGSTFDSFLEEEGIRGEVEAIAIKRVLAWAVGAGDAEAAQNEIGDGKGASYELITARSTAGPDERFCFPGQ